MKNKTLVLVILLIIICGIIIILKTFNNDNPILENNTTSSIDINLDTSDDFFNIDWSNYKEENISLTQSMNITSSGVYYLTGSMNGSITINTNDNVKLVLNNVNIKSTNGPAIMVLQADNVMIYLSEGTNNTLEDSLNYNLEDDSINGVIYSKDDLVFDGSGTLNIIANYQDGIVGKDDLKIMNGTYNITSVDDGIRGKDSVDIDDGTFNIVAGGDGIKSTNTSDETKGYILISKANMNIEAELDGIDASYQLLIKQGNFTIKTGGGSVNNSTSSDWGRWGKDALITSSDSNSAKGLKANDNLVIENGTFVFDTSDDSIHSNNYVGIKGGNIIITSGDDGIHADCEIIIDNGSIDINESYEGIEASKITINGGNIQVMSTDDGINIAGGNDASGTNRKGKNNYSENVNNILTINNGTIYVSSTGDGIDINGNGYMYNGTVYVDGPTNSGNGALDYDGELVVDGGTLIAVGASGMLQGVSSTKQNNVIITLTTNYSANSKITLLNNSQELITYTPSKSFSYIIVSSPLLTNKETYTIQINGETYDQFTITSLTTTVGSNNSFGGMNHRK